MCLWDCTRWTEEQYNPRSPAHWSCFRKEAVLINRLVSTEAVSHHAKSSAPSLIWSLSLDGALTQKWPPVCVNGDWSIFRSCGVNTTSQQLASPKAPAVVIIVFTGAVRERQKDNITGSSFSCCPSPQNTIIANEKVSLLVLGGGGGLLLSCWLCQTHTQGQCSFPELPLGLLGHSWMERFYITGLPVIVRGNHCD